MSRPAEWITPDWPVPAGVHSLVTTRHGGVSTGPYAGLNLGTHVGDAPEIVACNRRLLAAHLPAEPLWLEQVHGTDVVCADVAPAGARADAALTRQAGTVCAVMVADCLPVLLCDANGEVVAAAHAGWRGLAGGVLESTISAMGVPPARVLAWLGPAIGPAVFEVGDEVRAAFCAHDGAAAAAFVPGRAQGKWMADLFLLARQRLMAAGVAQVFGGGLCTVSDPARFYSYRRDGTTGRFAALVWRD